MKIKKIALLAGTALCAAFIVAQTNVIEEVAWVVGDQPIWKSEIEDQ